MEIVICGSMAFSKEMIKIAKALKENNHKVILPHNTDRYAEGIIAMEDGKESVKNKIKDNLITDYFQKIKKCDSILIVNLNKNGTKNYIGGNSFLEMGFAHVLGKNIYLYNNIPESSPYMDEIIAMQPIIINGDLSKIKNRSYK